MNKEQQEEFDKLMIDEYGKWKIGRVEAKNFINKLLKEERSSTKEWAERYIERDMKTYGTDKHGIALRDLVNYLEKYNRV